MAKGKKLAPKKFASVVLGGGLDSVTPPLLVEPGRAIQIKNFECDLNQGYKLMSGFERFDGLPSPTDTSFWSLELDDTTGGSQGQTITGDSSGATAEILYVADDGFYVINMSTTSFEAGESFTGPQTGTILSEEVENQVIAESGDNFNAIRLIKENYLRDDIAAVPGSGGVQGVWRHLGTTIAFRNNPGGTSSVLWRSTATGWEEVDLGHIVFFDTAANDTSAVVGATIDDGAGNSATLEAVGYNTVGKDDLGYFVLSGFTSGFAISANMTISAAAVGTVTVAGAAISLAPSGRHKFESHNFTGSEGFGADPDSYNVYGTDGENPAFEYWPTRNIYVPVYTDLGYRSIDIPSFVAVYKNKLFVGYERGIVRNSEGGNPFDWDAASGTMEVGVGSAVTGFDAVPSALVITTRRTTYAITGSTITDFKMDVVSQNTGAIKHTLQHIGTTFMLDDRGIIDLSRTEKYGNFENATVSKLIKAAVDELKPNAVASTVSLSKNIYRLAASDGTGISMTAQADGSVAFSLFDLDKNISCMSNAEDENGDERIFFGDDQGFVFEMDKGRTFDGYARQSWIQFAYHFLGSQTIRKRFFRMFFDMQVEGSGSFETIASYSLGSQNIKASAPATTTLETIAPLSSAWDSATWDVGLFDGLTTLADAHVELEGTGESISLTVLHNSDTDDIFTLKDVTYHYKKRTALRGAR